MLTDAAERLRRACIAGDMAAAQAALKSQPSTWQLLLRNIGLGWMSRANSGPPAQLDYVYHQDNANMPIHYLATGPTGWSAGWRKWLPTASPSTDSDLPRALLLSWLLESGKLDHLSAVNGSLDQPLHCCVKSSSWHVLKVLLQHALRHSPELVGRLLHARNLAGECPLQMAVAAQQWRGVHLLIAAGSLHGSRGFTNAVSTVASILESEQPPNPGSVLAGLGKLLDSLVGSAPPAADSAASSAQADTQDFTPVVLDDLMTVRAHRQQAIDVVCTAGAVPQAVALKLLQHHSWDVLQAVTACRRNLTDALRAAGMQAEVAVQLSEQRRAAADQQAAPPATPSHPPETASCLVCFEEQRSDVLAVQLPCRHPTCQSCWQGMARAALSDGNLQQLACPSPDCRLPLPASLVPQVLRGKRQQGRFLELLAQQHIAQHPLMRWCPKPACGQVVSLAPFVDEVSLSATQPLQQAPPPRHPTTVHCRRGHSFCFACGGAAHEPAGCEQAREWQALMAKLRATTRSIDEGWMTSHTKPCPGCGSRIQRISGCNHMICSQCRVHFCWMCGDRWDLHGTSTGGYYLCNKVDPEALRQAAGRQQLPVQAQGVLGQLFTPLQAKVSDWKFTYFLRRYVANEPSEALMLRSAQRCAELIHAALPGALLRRGDALGRGPEALKKVVDLGAVLEDGRGCAAQPPSATRQAGSPEATCSSQSPAEQPSQLQAHPGAPPHAGSASPSAAEPCPGPQQAQTGATLTAAVADLARHVLPEVAREVTHCRQVLQSSVVLGYFISPEACSRLEQHQARLWGLTEQLSTLLAQLPHHHWHLTPEQNAQAPHCRREEHSPRPCSTGVPQSPGQKPGQLLQQLLYALALHRYSAAISQQLCKLQEARSQLLHFVRAGDLHKVATGQSACADHGPITQIAAALKYFSG